MKYHFILTSALTSLCLLTSHNVLATDSTNVSALKEERWFEIEVILFKQVSNNSENTEQFSPNDLNAKKSRAFDLIAPYLQPDIASLKQLLPSCEQAETKLPYNITISPYHFWSEDSNTETTEVIAENRLSERGYQAQYATIELPVYNQYPVNNPMSLCVIPAEFFQQNLNSAQLKHFSIDGFPVDKLTGSINGLEQWQDDENAEITWASDSPYLISQNSLRLQSIAHRIKRSRDYAPILHLGWRQKGESKRKAKAINLYAGEHLELRYQQATAKQIAEQQTLEIQTILEQRQQAEALIRSQSAASGVAVENSAVFSELSIAEELRQQVKQQQLNKLFKQFSLLESQEVNATSTSKNNTNELVKNEETRLTEEATKGIIAQLSADITRKELPLRANNATENREPITAPLQPWSIDGLFKVHLDHYLYIDTELNIIDSLNALSALTTKQKLTGKKNKTSPQNKVISFKQDRRVITGEIHYFDHPNIGMVVQIRRFDPTKPADEAVSQSKK